MQCKICGFENDADAGFCVNCGISLTVVCPSCGSPLKPGIKFCKVCGAPVTSPETPQASRERLQALQQSAPASLKEKIELSSAQIEGERKPVTILFTDIVGSTAMAEKLDPEEWKEIVSGAHRIVSEAVYRYEGTIAQLLGDGVLAFFGAPVTHEDDPIRALQAALDIQQAVGRYSDSLRGMVDSFQMRIGINTGTVVVGNVGSDLHMEYLAVGDAVNLAARLQSAARPGGILISQPTARLVSAAFELASMEPINVKGKSEPVSVFEVLGRKTSPEGLRGYAELFSPLVGRERELSELRGALDALLEGHGQVVTIIGEAGIGKSRLIEEARLHTPESGTIRWLEGRSLSYGQTLSFWTISQLIYNDLGLTESDPEVRLRAALRRRVNELFGEKAGEVCPYIGQLLGINLEDSLSEQVRQLDGETIRYQTLLSFTRYFQRLAEIQPTVLVFDDLHWADPSTLEALEQLLAVTDRVPLMLILLSRLERQHPSWNIKLKAETDYAHRYTEIQLKPLSASEQACLVDNLLAIADLPSFVRQVIYEHTEGNPFFMEEIVRSLIDQGVLEYDGARWRPSREITDIDIPDTLQGMLLARIDRLQEDVRRTLQLASVIGKSFLYRILQAIAEAEQQLDGHLSQLQRVDLVREKTRLPELEYMFRHSLTQEAAYNSLLVERRREFHLRVGEALEKLFAERREQFLGLLAHHFELAGETAKALEYLLQAGDQARLTDEHSEAVGFYRRAVTLLTEVGDQGRAAQVWLKLGLVYNANFQFKSAHQANETAFQLQQLAGPSQTHLQENKQHHLHICIRHPHVTLDPGKIVWGQDIAVTNSLFSGLARLDVESNVVPEVARSWEVLDEGTRYLFHLREDWFWTDGRPVTARDFEWAWKRNLNPGTNSDTARFLYDVTGALDYNQGKSANQHSVGVKALDLHTLEVQLVEPVAYFPFIITMPCTYPLPEALVNALKDAWWQPEHIVSNGAYRLVAFDAQQGGIMERNTGYPGDIPGNVIRQEWKVMPEIAEMNNAYKDNRADLAFIIFKSDIAGCLPNEEIYHSQELGSYFLVFNPNSPPFDDLRVRKAVAMTLDRQRQYEKFNVPVSLGGLVPPGMPGHSPDIGLPFDVEMARKLMDEAGYPGGQGFPEIKALSPKGGLDIFEDMTRQWRAYLGIDIVFEGIGPWELGEWQKSNQTSPLVITGWVADYPDPDNFLRCSGAITLLHYFDWQDKGFNKLVEEAARTTNRARRMAMYRQADHLLISDQALLVLLSYNYGVVMVKPWVKHFAINLLGNTTYQNILVEAH